LRRINLISYRTCHILGLPSIPSLVAVNLRYHSIYSVINRWLIPVMVKIFLWKS